MIALNEKIFLTRKYTTMSATAQALFLQLWCSADDEGVTDKADKTIISTIARRASRKPAWQELIDNGYILVSEKPEFAGYAYIVGYRETNSGKRWKKTSIHGDFLEAIGKESTIETTKRKEPAKPATKPGKPMQGASTITRELQEQPELSQIEKEEQQRKQAREERKARKMVINDDHYGIHS